MPCTQMCLRMCAEREREREREYSVEKVGDDNEEK